MIEQFNSRNGFCIIIIFILLVIFVRSVADKSKGTIIFKLRAGCLHYSQSMLLLMFLTEGEKRIPKIPTKVLTTTSALETSNKVN